MTTPPTKPALGMNPWHASNIPVHHHEPDCPNGARIPEAERIDGDGDWRPACEWCFDKHLRRIIEYQVALTQGKHKPFPA